MFSKNLLNTNLKTLLFFKETFHWHHTQKCDFYERKCAFHHPKLLSNFFNLRLLNVLQLFRSVPILLVTFRERG